VPRFVEIRAEMADLENFLKFAWRPLEVMYYIELSSDFFNRVNRKINYFNRALTR